LFEWPNFSAEISTIILLIIQGVSRL